MIGTTSLRRWLAPATPLPADPGAAPYNRGERAAWALLALLLVATLVFAASFDRRTWPGLVGDEATYLMQAQSLAFDGDLLYTARDHDRFLALWKTPPEGLILQSGDGGETLTFGKPPFYAAVLAPFVRWAPVRGPLVANALLLSLAALLTAVALRRHLGPASPLWAALFVFGSVSFAYVFWIHADLFLMVLCASALALAYLAPDGTERTGVHPPPAGADWSDAVRWATVGALLATVTLSRPLYATLFLPAVLAVPRADRRAGSRLAALAAGALTLALAAVALSFALHGHWSSYGGERMGFYSYTGYPEVDFPASAWPEKLAERAGPGSWGAARSMSIPVLPEVTGWNIVYFLAGRNVGLIPYFLPGLAALLVLARGTARRGRWALPVAVALTAACFLYIRPFNFYGGGGAIANRYFLPVYPALWFVAGRHLSWLRRSLPTAALTLLVAAPFLWPLWSAPRSHLRGPGGGYSYVSTVARSVLPYETTLDHLKPSGREDLIHHGLWLKLLGPEVRPVEEGWLELEPGETGELLVGTRRPLKSLRLELAPPGPGAIEVIGAQTDPSVAPSEWTGGAYLLTLDEPRATHRMWWSEDDVWLYRLVVEVPSGAAPGRSAVRFRLIPVEPAPG